MNIKDSLAHQILQRAYKNFNWPINFFLSHLNTCKFPNFNGPFEVFYGPFAKFDGPTGIILGWPDPFCEKTINVLQKWTLFLAEHHIQAIQILFQLCSNVDIKDSRARQILQRAYKNFKWRVKIWKFACI